MTKHNEPIFPMTFLTKQPEIPVVKRSENIINDSSLFSYLKDPMTTKRINNITVPIYINDEGYKTIPIPVKEFVCAGESAPMDHPHVFLTMGTNDFILCPYCSTRYDYIRSYKGTDI